MALAVDCLAGGHFDPAFTDAVLLHVLALVVVQADADFVLEHGGYVVGAARVRGQMVWQRRALEGVGHGGLQITDPANYIQLRCRTEPNGSTGFESRRRVISITLRAGRANTNSDARSPSIKRGVRSTQRGVPSV